MANNDPSPLLDPAVYALKLEDQILTLKLLDESKRAYAASQRPPVKQAEILNLRERLKRERTTTPWRIQDCQFAGQKVMLVAQFKSGKTTLAGNLTRSILDGDPFLGTFAVTPLGGTESIAILDFEMSQEQVENWYADQGITNDDRCVLVTLRGSASTFNILDEKVRSEWAAKFQERHVKYLVLDCLRPLMDALGLNEHTEAGVLFGALDALLLEAGISEALVIHHMGHKGEHGRGDSRIMDWPDATWTLTRLDENPASSRFFRAYGRDVDIPETELAYDPDTRHLSIADGGGSRKEVQMSAAVVAVVAYVQAQNLNGVYPSRNKIVEGVMPQGHSQAAVKVAISKADQGGLIYDNESAKVGKAYQAQGQQTVDAGLLKQIEAM